MAHGRRGGAVSSTRAGKKRRVTNVSGLRRKFRKSAHAAFIPPDLDQRPSGSRPVDSNHVKKFDRERLLREQASLVGDANEAYLDDVEVLF